MQGESSWLADGVREIERVVKQGQIVEPKLIELPKEKKGTYGVLYPSPAGTVEKIDVRVAGPTWHKERLDDPKQLIAFINSLEGRQLKASDGAVYIGQDLITFAYSFEDRRHRASCPLILSQPWKWLKGCPVVLAQKDAVRALRIIFDGCLPPDSNLINVLRKVNWKQDGSVEGTVQKGREGLGASIVREIQGINDFPDEFTVTVRVYENVLQTVRVRVALEILPDVAKFEFIPFPNQLHNGLTETQEWLRKDIEDATGVPTFIGAVTTSDTTND
jgi:hypothetical protein